MELFRREVAVVWQRLSAAAERRNPQEDLGAEAEVVLRFLGLAAAAPRPLALEEERRVRVCHAVPQDQAEVVALHLPTPRRDQLLQSEQ